MSDSLKRTKLSYTGGTEEDRAAMLAAIGVPGIDALFEQIPEEARLARPLRLPPGMSEQDVVDLCQGMAGRNSHQGELTSFLGAGAYDHYIPAVVDAVISRSEFYTAYTPYQPEASQGILQTIYEYQSMICGLTGMEVSNASLYDAATAIGEAAIMAAGITGRNRVLVSRAVHPHYRQVLSTYTSGLGIEIAEIDYTDGVTDLGGRGGACPERSRRVRAANQQSAISNPSTAAQGQSAIIVQYPNFFGCIEPIGQIAEAAHRVGALLIVCADPIALGLLTPPGDCGADIVVGEGQPLGVPTGFGGPFLGIFACRKDYVRHVPGRLVGKTVDGKGRTAYTLTLQTREQHIRREKATSNICTNQALVALAATVYLAALGKNGLRQVAELCFHKAHYAERAICAHSGSDPSAALRARSASPSRAWDAPFFKEFVIKLDRPVSEVNRWLLENGILGGLDLGRYYPELENHMLLCVTEKRRKEEIDRLAGLLRQQEGDTEQTLIADKSVCATAPQVRVGLRRDCAEA